MSRTKKWLALSTAGVVLLGAGLAFARHGRGMNPERAERFVHWRVDSALSSVDASEAQKKQIDDIVDRLMAQAKPLMEENRRARKEALALLESPNPDAAKAHALLDQRLDALRAFGHSAIDGVMQAHGVLTPEQRAKLAERAKQRMSRHHADE
jgi:Spy/CpxP family protein refolding chaperone